MATHTHSANILWDRTQDDPENLMVFSRKHTWGFDSGQVIDASSAPAFKGDESCVDPEEALVASLSSCHMLTFLFFAMKDGYCPVHYEDKADGLLQKNEKGKLAITHITLHPKTEWRGDKQPSAEEIKALHDKAHENCFIASSINAEVRVELL